VRNLLAEFPQQGLLEHIPDAGIFGLLQYGVRAVPNSVEHLIWRGISLFAAETRLETPASRLDLATALSAAPVTWRFCAS